MNWPGERALGSCNLPRMNAEMLSLAWYCCPAWMRRWRIRSDTALRSSVSGRRVEGASASMGIQWWKAAKTP